MVGEIGTTASTMPKSKSLAEKIEEARAAIVWSKQSIN